jgi:hypothetical protein
MNFARGPPRHGQGRACSRHPFLHDASVLRYRRRSEGSPSGPPLHGQHSPQLVALHSEARFRIVREGTRGDFHPCQRPVGRQASPRPARRRGPPRRDSSRTISPRTETCRAPHSGGSSCCAATDSTRHRLGSGAVTLGARWIAVSVRESIFIAGPAVRAGVRLPRAPAQRGGTLPGGSAER